METAVKLKGINKDFAIGDRKIRVINDVSVDINFGELTMVVGPSGCGKTTLISILSGILSATDGQIEVMGTSLTNISDREKVLFRREHIGFIFQQYNLLPALTAAENAALALTAAGVPDSVALPKVRKILEEIGMEGQTEKYSCQLSGGQQQRVAIARALVHDPKLIVCDEPTAALDAKSGQQVMEILRKIADDKSRTVLIVTHDNRIFNFADRILEMSDGEIIGDFTANEFLKKEH
jgi:putative ABC transport system ATP-binding protein